MRTIYKSFHKVPKSWLPDGEFLNFDIESIANTITVFDRENEARETGLIDKYGDPYIAINRYIEPIGFITFPDEDE